MRDKKYVLTVTVNPALDKTMAVRRFQAQKEYVAEYEILTAGGKGLEVSRMLKHLGVSTVATGLLGGWTGGKIKLLLDEDDVCHHFSPVQKEARINITIVDSSKKNTRILSAGPKVTMQEIKRFKTLYQKLLRGASWVVITGRNAQGMNPSFYAQLIRLANERKVPVILDAARHELLLGARARPYLIKVNQEEAQQAVKFPLDSFKELKKAVGFFHRLGARHVMISLGGQGAVASDGAAMWHIRTPRIRIKNDVGCGDAMIAGFLYAQSKCQAFFKSAQWAVACGTASALSLKPGQLSRKDSLRVSGKLKAREFIEKN